LSRCDYHGLMKITDRAIQMLVLWKKVFLKSNQNGKYERLVSSVDSTIAELAEHRFELKRRLKGKEDFSLPEKLHLLLEGIEEAQESDGEKVYIESLLKLTKKILAEGHLEVTNG